MVTLGRTSSATSNEAQVRRVVCTEISRTPGLAAAGLEVPVEVPRLDRRAEPGGEGQAVVLPSSASLGTVLSWSSRRERRAVAQMVGRGRVASDDSVLVSRCRSWRRTRWSW